MCYKIQKIYFGFTYASSEVHFRSTESQTFYWSIMTADDSIKCLCPNSGMTGQVGGFQNPRVCLQVFPSFLPHPLPALLLTPFFARCLTLVPRSLLLNRTETLARQAKLGLLWFCLKPVNLLVSQYRPPNLPEKMSFSFFVLPYFFTYKPSDFFSFRPKILGDFSRRTGFGL